MRDAGWLLTLTAGLALGAYLLVLDGRGGAGHPDELRLEPLLALDVERLTALEITVDGELSRIERGGARWQYADTRDRPDLSGADPADFIAERVAMLSAARIERSFEIATDEQSVFGFDDTRLVVDLFVDGATQRSVRYIAGSRTPDGFGQYLLAMPDGKTVTVPAYQIENLARIAYGR